MNKIDYTPIGRDVVWKVKEKRDSGLILSEASMMMEETDVVIVATGSDVKVIKPGDRVVLRGGCRPTLVILNKEKYGQVSEGECLGIVGKDVDTTIPENVFTPPPGSIVGLG